MINTNIYTPFYKTLIFSEKQCSKDYSLITSVIELINSFVSYPSNIQIELIQHIPLFSGRISKDSFISVLSIITNNLFNKNSNNVNVQLKYMEIIEILFKENLLIISFLYYN